MEESRELRRLIEASDPLLRNYILLLKERITTYETKESVLLTQVSNLRRVEILEEDLKDFTNILKELNKDLKEELKENRNAVSKV